MSAPNLSIVPVRVSYPSPQILVEFDYCYGTHQTLADGTELWSNMGHVVISLKKKMSVTEYRGFTSDPSANYQNSTHYSSVTAYGTGNKVLGTYTYADTETTYECVRINEADMWRVIETTTTATPVTNLL